MHSVERRVEALGMETTDRPAGRPAKFGQPWSDDDIARLREMTAARRSLADIAAALERPVRAIHQRRFRLRAETTAAFTCSHCRIKKAADQFTPSMRFRGGRCHACCRALTQPRTRA